MRAYGGHSIIIQGQRVNINIARLTYKCFFCLAPLDRVNFGLKCSENKNHYGFIHQTEAKITPTEVRFMKISDMFPSEYLRGIDVHDDVKVTIKSIIQENARNRETGTSEQMYVMHFEGMKKGLRLNLTMAKECAKFLGSVDTDDWLGKQVTLYRTIVKAFGQEHIVPRIRKPEPKDKVWQPEGQKKPATNSKNGNGKKPAFPNAKAKEFWDAVQVATGNFYKDASQLTDVIGGWFNFGDNDEWASRMSMAVDNANQSDGLVPVQQASFDDEPAPDGAYGEDS